MMKNNFRIEQPAKNEKLGIPLKTWLRHRPITFYDSSFILTKNNQVASFWNQLKAMWVNFVKNIFAEKWFVLFSLEM